MSETMFLMRSSNIFISGCASDYVCLICESVRDIEISVTVPEVCLSNENVR